MIQFPGLGIELKVDPVMLRITDSFSLKWYGFIITLGIVLAVLYCVRKGREFHIAKDDILDMVPIAAAVALVTARLLYVLTNWADYAEDPIKIIQTWEGGMAIYGGILGGVVACALFCWLRHIHIGAMLDLGAFGLLIGQAVGRWGNFINGEVYGGATDLPWRMTVFNANGTLRAAEVHPLFFYECLWNVLGFFVLLAFAKKRRFNGQIFMLYIAWYGIGRAVMEGMRDEQFHLMVGNLMFSRVIAIASAVAALLLLFYHEFIKKHKPEEIYAWETDYKEHQEYVKAKKDRKNTANTAESPTEAPEQSEGESSTGDTSDSSGKMDENHDNNDEICPENTINHREKEES